MHGQIVTPTPELFQIFQGKQLELRNTPTNTLLRGQITDIVVTADQIVVKFDWLVKNRGGVIQRFSHGWEKDDQEQLTIKPNTAIFTKIDQHIFVTDTTGNRIVFVATNQGNINPNAEGLL